MEAGTNRSGKIRTSTDEANDSMFEKKEHDHDNEKDTSSEPPQEAEKKDLDNDNNPTITIDTSAAQPEAQAKVITEQNEDSDAGSGEGKGMLYDDCKKKQLPSPSKKKADPANCSSVVRDKANENMDDDESDDASGNKSEKQAPLEKRKVNSQGDECDDAIAENDSGK